MSQLTRSVAVAGDADPLDVLAAWSHDQALVMLHSGAGDSRWARWSILAQPRGWYRYDGASRLIDLPDWINESAQLSHDPLNDLDGLLRVTGCSEPVADRQGPPFRGGWIGCFSYDLGRAIEPCACATGADGRPGARDLRLERGGGSWPLIEMAWCPDALVFDRANRRWHAVGHHDHAAAQITTGDNASADHHGFHLGAFTADARPGEYQTLVERTLEYIAAGDVFQANIAQRMSADFAGCTRALARRAFDIAQPWYGAYLECPAVGLEPRRRLLSLSPELFLEFETASRAVVTRPVKGTRPISCDPRALRDAAKDAAELNMIIDLMRNDLGRVCDIGTIRVAIPRAIETHATVHHGVGEVAGRLRANAGLREMLQAAFPAGSVTGAPKIRAMQIIDELEPIGRGPYCGSIGFISRGGQCCLNVAIRTLIIEAGADDDPRSPRLTGRAQYFAGAGIVADSDPEQEHRETLDKAAVLELITRGPRQRSPARQVSAAPFSRALDSSAKR